MKASAAIATLGRPITTKRRHFQIVAGMPHLPPPVAALRRRYSRCSASALDAILGRACVLCDEPGPDLCDACVEDSLGPATVACPCCAIPLAGGDASHPCGRCVTRPPAFDASLAAALYEAPLDALVRGLKYGARFAYVRPLAHLLHRRFQDRPPALDVLLPVPLSRDRMASRGFNQSIEIARALARLLKIRLDTASVLRILDTPPQAALPFEARRKNIRGAFAVIDSRRSLLDGLTVGVVDDVMTTGSTLDEMAATLKRAGAARVVNLVVARTP